jgi:hypothetical protein
VLISNKHKFVYIDIPKTGSISIEQFFQKNYAGTRLHPDEKYQKHRLDIPEQYQNYEKIISVRNPYDRFVSYFFYHRKKRYSPQGLDTLEQFGEYLVKLPKSLDRDIYLFYPMWRYIEAVGEYDTVLKLECLEEDLLQLGFVKQVVNLPYSNKTMHPSWDEIQTPHLTDLVHEWAGKDFDLFGYDKICKQD